MHFLFIAIAPPYPANVGQRMRNWAILNALHSDRHHVDLLAFAEAQESRFAPRELREICGSAVYISGPRAHSISEIAGRLITLFRGLPFGVWRMRSAQMRATVAGALKSRHYDYIIVDEIYQRINVPVSRVPVLLNKDGLVSEIMDRHIERESSIVRRIYAKLECERVKKWESRSCADASAVLACSQRDAETIRSRAPSSRTFVVPNAVDVSFYRCEAQDDDKTVLFVGAMDWMPNEDAVAFFAEQIWPKVQASVPDARFVVAGRNPRESFVRRYRHLANVYFTNAVKDIRPFIANAAVSIVPLRTGSGTRMKILEAAAMGKAIVSTTIGAEGLNFLTGEEIEIADDPEAFAAAVKRFLSDRSRRQAFGVKAQHRVVREHSLEVLRESFRAVFSELAR